MVLGRAVWKCIVDVSWCSVSSCVADLEVLGTPCHPHSTEEAENLCYSRGGAESVPLPHAIVVKS